MPDATEEERSEAIYNLQHYLAVVVRIAERREQERLATQQEDAFLHPAPLDAVD